MLPEVPTWTLLGLGLVPWEATHQVRSVPNPAAGADWSLQVPGGQVWLVEAWAASFATSAATGNRFAAAVLRRQGQAAAIIGLTGAVGASASVTVSVGVGGMVGFAGGTTGIVSGGLPAMLLEPGDSVGSLTQGIAAGDQWSGIVVAWWAWELRGAERALERYLGELARWGVGPGAPTSGGG